MCHCSLCVVNPGTLHLSIPADVLIQSIACTGCFKVRTAMVQAATSTSTIAAAAPLLNVYKKLPVIRVPSDSLTFEDAEGNQKSVSVQELGDAIATAVRLLDCEYLDRSIVFH